MSFQVEQVAENTNGKNHEVRYFATPYEHNRHFFLTFFTDIEFSLFICLCLI